MAKIVKQQQELTKPKEVVDDCKKEVPNMHSFSAFKLSQYAN